MTTTPTASPELLDLDKLEALARAAKSEVRSPRIENQCASEYDLAMAMDSDTVLALIALARRAQPEGEAPQAGCTVPPEGWYCTRAPGHDGPCAARPIAQQAAAPGALQTAKNALQLLALNLVPHNPRAVAKGALGAIEIAERAATSAPGTPEAPSELAHGHRDDYYLLANGRRLGLEPISRVRNMPNWVLAMELFATGSGSAYQICRDAGVDPESTTIQRAAQLNGGQEGSESNG